MSNTCEQCGRPLPGDAPILNTDAATTWLRTELDKPILTAMELRTHPERIGVRGFMAGATEFRDLVLWYLHTKPAIPKHLRVVLEREIAQLLGE